jgi:hypothetical protein
MARLALSAALRRALAAALGTAILLPAAAGAQAPGFPDDVYPVPALRIVPFVGWAPGVTREESWRYADEQGVAVRENVDMRLAGGPAAGVLAHFALNGPFSLVGGALYLERDAAEFTIDGGDTWVFTSTRNVLLKAGLGMELRERDELMARRLGAGVFVAPFYMLELPDDIAGIEGEALTDPVHHFGLNLGVTGELPFMQDRLALQLGFEDYLTLWNEGALERLPDWVRNAPTSPTEVSTELSHQWLVRAGLSFRL